MAREDIGPRSELVDVTLLNVHVVKLPSKHICLYSQICDALCLGQTNILLQWVGLNAETRSCSRC